MTNPALKPMRPADLLFSQGFGTRRVCAGLVEHGLVRFSNEKTSKIAVKPAQAASISIAKIDLEDATPAELDTPVLPYNGMPFEVQGVQWQFHAAAYLVLHKPAGFECSHKASHWPSIYTLLPQALRQRPTKTAIQGVQAVGRLDQDTTGLLLLSDDGAFVHRMTGPKYHVPKVYEVSCDREVTGKQIDALLAGVLLNDERETVAAHAAVATGERTLSLTLTQGKYHQVKRMLAAVGNHVVGLHRSRQGGLELGELQPGQWRWLTDADMALLK